MTPSIFLFRTNCIRKFVLAAADDETEFIAPFFNICLEILKDARKEGMFKPDVGSSEKTTPIVQLYFAFRILALVAVTYPVFSQSKTRPSFGTDSAVV